MADTPALVAELQGKLAELNAKVATFQQQMVRHFEADIGFCLENCPDHVSSEVRRIITASMPNYPALCPRDGGHGIQSPPPDRVDVVEPPPGWAGSQSPPPSGAFKDGTDTRHQREKDLEGVFTPGYLPLLGDSHRQHRSSPGPLSPTTSSTSSTLAPQTSPEPSPALSVKEGKRPMTTTPTRAPAPDLPSRPTMPSAITSLTPPSGRAMPSAIASLTPPSGRRSALRRSSSVSLKGGASPRQVRFSHEGEEVLPTASPPKSTPMSIPYSLRTVQTGDEHPEGEFGDDKASDEPSLWDVEGKEDAVPKKKITPTQILQVFTRMPSEGSHVKEVPGGEAGGPLGYIVSVNGQAHTLRAPEPGSDLMAADSTDLTLKKPVGELWERAKDQPLDEDILLASLRSPSKAFKAGHDGSLDLQDSGGPSNTKPCLDDDEEEETSEDDFVEMRSLSKSPKGSLGTKYSVGGSPVGNGSTKETSNGNGSPKGSANGNGSLQRTSSKGSLLDLQRAASSDSPLKRSTSMGSLTDLQSRSGLSKQPSKHKASPAGDADPFFDLSDEEDKQGEEKYLSGDDDNDDKYLADDDGNDDDDVPLSTKTSLRMAATGTGGKPTPIANTSPSTALFSPVVGSYLGSPFNLAPIRNAQLYDEIAGMKDVHSFIGSIDGRSGLDSADAGSYRAAMTKNLGAHPKSFTERLALEEAMERRASDEDEEAEKMVVREAENMVVEEVEDIENPETPEATEETTNLDRVEEVEEPEEAEEVEKPEKLVESGNGTEKGSS